MNRTHPIAAAIAALTLVLVAYALWPNQAHGDSEKPDDDRATPEFLEGIESLAKFTDAPSFRQEAGDRPSHRLRGKLIGALEDDLEYTACVSELGDLAWYYEPILTDEFPTPGFDAPAFQDQLGRRRVISLVGHDGSFEVEVKTDRADDADLDEVQHVFIFARRKSSPSGKDWGAWPAPVVADFPLSLAHIQGEEPVEIEMSPPLRIELRIDRREAEPGIPVEMELVLVSGGDILSHHPPGHPDIRLVCPEEETIVLLLPRLMQGERIFLGAASQNYRTKFATEMVKVDESKRVDLKVHGFATVQLRIPIPSGQPFQAGDVGLRYSRIDRGPDDEVYAPDREAYFHWIHKLDEQELGAELQLLAGTWQIEVHEQALPLNRIRWKVDATPGAQKELRGSWKKARAALEFGLAYRCPSQPMYQPKFWWRSHGDGWQTGENLRWKTSDISTWSRTVSRDVEAAAVLLLCGTGEDPPRSQLCLLSTASIQATSSATHFLGQLELANTSVEVPPQSGKGSYTIEWSALSAHHSLPIPGDQQPSEQTPVAIYSQPFSPRGGRILGFPTGLYRLITRSKEQVEFDELIRIP